MDPPHTWLLLSYKVPREPTAGRVYVWRKLKQLGAIALQDAFWVLPAAVHTREQFRWLASEISELGGKSTLWESRLLEGDETHLIEMFTTATDKDYRKILADLRKKRRDLPSLGRKYQQLLSQDYFRSKLGAQVRQALLAAKGDKP